jgi:DNA-binding transcriptional ArsR family regulator
MFYRGTMPLTSDEARRRLEGLLETRFCDAEDAEEHGSRLKELADAYLDGFDFEGRAKVHSALSEGTRLRILKLLGFREMCVCELTAALDMNQPNLSYHVKKLEKAGLVRSAKMGKWVYYSLADEERLQQREIT